MIELIDLFFIPIINLLTTVKTSLSQAIIISSQGLNVGYYLGFLSPLGPAWVSVISRLFLCSFFVFVVAGITGWYLYLKIKDSIMVVVSTTF